MSLDTPENFGSYGTWTFEQLIRGVERHDPSARRELASRLTGISRCCGNPKMADPEPSAEPRLPVGELNRYVDEASEISENRGWTVPKFTNADGILAKLMLVTTEVAEAAEAVRNNDLANYREELADICIRVFHLAWMSERENSSEAIALGRWSLEQEIVDKLQKNRERPYRHGGKRA